MAVIHILLVYLLSLSINQLCFANIWHKRWTSSSAGSSFASEALICDLNLDNQLDLFAATVDGELIMLDLNTGQPQPGTHWPLYRHGEHFFTKPFLYDVDHDGDEEVVFLSHSGEFTAYNWHGVLVHSWALPHVSIQRNWFETSTSLSGSELNKSISFTAKTHRNEYYELTPHVWTTGQIIDYNQDSRLEELVLAMNYIGHDARMNASHVLAIVMIFNLTSSELANTIPLELTKSSSEYPSYILANPQIADIVNYAPGLEVMVATSSGMLYVISTRDSSIISGFPVEYGPMEQSPVLIMSGVRSSRLLIVVSDSSGNVLCVDSTGKSVWEFTNKHGAVTRPLHMKGTIIFADKYGYVYALDSKLGRMLSGFPIKFNASFTVEGTLLQDHTNTYTAFLSSLGDLFILDVGSPNSSEIVELHEASFMPLQFLPPRQSSDLLLLSKDGVLVQYNPESFGRNQKIGPTLQFAEHDVFLKTHLFTWKHSSNIKATGSYLSIDFNIVDDGAPKSNIYLVKIYLGNLEVHNSKMSYHDQQSIRLKVDERPFRGRLTLLVISPSGLVFTDSAFLALNWHFLLHLSHLLYLPAFCLLGGLLILTITRETELLLPLQSGKSRR